MPSNLKWPPDQWAVRHEPHYALGAGNSHPRRTGPKEHDNHADASDQKRYLSGHLTIRPI